MVHNMENSRFTFLFHSGRLSVEADEDDLELFYEINDRIFLISVAYCSEHPDIAHPQPPVPSIIKPWCKDHGWTDLTEVDGILWAIPPATVMPVPLLPKGEKYCGFVLFPTICQHGWTCDFYFPDNKERFGASNHRFLCKSALEWGKKMVDSERVYTVSSEPREFADESIQLRPFYKLLDSAFEALSDRDSAEWLLAAYLLIYLSDRGEVSFWESVLSKTIGVKPRQLTRSLNKLVNLGIIRYQRWPNKNYPTSFSLGPAWLSVDGLTLSSDELKSILEGDVFKGEEGYHGSLSWGKRIPENSRKLTHESGALLQRHKSKKYPKIYSTWVDGKWTHLWQPSAEPKVEDVSNRMSFKDRFTIASVVHEPVSYVGYNLIPRQWPSQDESIIEWFCDVKASEGNHLTGNTGKTYKNKELALEKARELIDIRNKDWLRQNLSTNANECSLIQHLDSIVEHFYPTANDLDKRVLQTLIFLWKDQGRIGLWERFLAAGLDITTRQLLKRCRKLANAGLLRYRRDKPNTLNQYSIGPAWLHADSCLTKDQLRVLIKAEHFWTCRTSSREVNHDLGPKIMDLSWDDDDRYSFNSAVLMGCEYEMLRWEILHDGNALVRIRLEPTVHRWHSTWENMNWYHFSV